VEGHRHHFATHGDGYAWMGHLAILAVERWRGFCSAGEPGAWENLRFGKDASVKPGDFNRDGIVNSADYNVWLANNGKTVPIYSGADANGDARVTTADYAIWAANVPEPGSWILILVGLCVTALRSARSGRAAAGRE
jgi:hypothetical protein